MPAFPVRALAEADVQAAFDWYEAQAQGLGHEFLRALDVCYAFRRALLRRFPYLVYYRASVAVIEVAACVHGKQHPRRWRRRT